MDVVFVPGTLVDAEVRLKISVVEFRQRRQQINSYVLQLVVREVDPFQVRVAFEQVAAQRFQLVEGHIQVTKLCETLQVFFDDSFETRRESENTFKVFEELVEIFWQTVALDGLDTDKLDIVVGFCSDMSSADLIDSRNRSHGVQIFRLALIRLTQWTESFSVCDVKLAGHADCVQARYQRQQHKGTHESRKFGEC